MRARPAFRGGAPTSQHPLCLGFSCSVSCAACGSPGPAPSYLYHVTSTTDRSWQFRDRHPGHCVTRCFPERSDPGQRGRPASISGSGLSSPEPLVSRGTPYSADSQDNGGSCFSERRSGNNWQSPEGICVLDMSRCRWTPGCVPALVPQGSGPCHQGSLVAKQPEDHFWKLPHQEPSRIGPLTQRSM